MRALRVFPGFTYKTPIQRRMMRSMKQYCPNRLPGVYFMGFGATDTEGRYLPTASEIVAYPEPGKFYKFGTYKEDETYYGIAKRAYGADNVKKGLLLMNASTWNDHINRKKKGWEAYNVKGLQSTPDYDSTNNPRAKVLSGHEYPVVWIPPLTGAEPEDSGYGDDIVTTPTPVPTPTPGPAGPIGPQGPKGDPGPPPSSSDIQAAVNQYFVTNPPPSGSPGAQGPKGDPGPPPSSSDVQAAVNQYFVDNPVTGGGMGPQGPTGPSGPIGPQGPKGDPGPPPSSSAIKSAVDDWLTANPPTTTAPGGGDNKKLWALPLAALAFWK